MKVFSRGIFIGTSKRKHWIPMAIFALVSAALLVFQNCSQSQFATTEITAEEKSSLANLISNNSGTTSESGNGTGYGGKIYSQIGDCNSVRFSAIRSIRYSEESSTAVLIRKDCKNLDKPEQIAFSEIQKLNAQQIEHQSIIYQEELSAISEFEENLNSSSPFQWSAPGLGNIISVSCWGAGGGGGGGAGGGMLGAGGGGGGFSSAEIPRANISAPVNVIIGSPGIGAPIGNADGADGSPTYFGNFLTASGGTGGRSTCFGGAAGLGGAGSNSNGMDGKPAGQGEGGNSGSSPEIFGAGGATGQNGSSPGGGGGGGIGIGNGAPCGSGTKSGDGGKGLCIIRLK